MISKAGPVPNREPGWVKMPLDLVRSDAWRSLSINGRRVIDFLVVEHIEKFDKEGTKNGKLKAPYEQLETIGIGARHVADAIRDVEHLGLIKCQRGGMRVISRYSLTWLPLHDGSPPTDEWRVYRNPELKPWPAPKNRNLPSEGKVALPSEGKADWPKKRKSASQREGRLPENLPSEGKVLSRSSTRGRTIISELRVVSGEQSPRLPGPRRC